MKEFTVKTSDMMEPGAKVHRKKYSSKVVFAAMPVFGLVSTKPAVFVDKRGK